MLITCPFCHSEATLSQNPAHAERISSPLYLLACSGCERTSVRHENQELLVTALVGNRHGSGNHELTVVTRRGEHATFHTDPTGQMLPTVEHSPLLDYVTGRIRASDTFTLLLHTTEVGARYLSPTGQIPYTALRGWVVTNGDIHALTGQEVWETSAQNCAAGEWPDPEADIHYVDADDIPRPYPW